MYADNYTLYFETENYQKNKSIKTHVNLIMK